MTLISNQHITQFLNVHRIYTRPNAGSGLWLKFLLPLSLLISHSSHPIISTSTYKLSSIFSVGLILSSLVFLYEITTKRLKFVNVSLLGSAFFVAILFQVCLHRGLLFSVWSALISTLVYHKLYLVVLKRMPNCFTLGEAAICTQSYVFLLYFTAVNIFQHFGRSSSSVVQMSTLTIQIGLVGISLIIILSYKFNLRSPVQFYALTGFVFVFFVVLPLQLLLRVNPLLWILHLLWEDIQTSKVVLYWALFVVVTVATVNKRIKEAKKASTAVRKIFHVLTVAVFIPGLFYNCAFLYLASGVVFGIFFMLEVLRVLNLPPLGQALQNGLVVFCDEKDAGIIAFTPMYLLAGCALPLWMHPSPCDVTNTAGFSLLPLMSGLLIIGIGDTAASVVGSKYGRHRWNGTNKTFEGTLACISSQLLVIGALVYLGFLKLPTFKLRLQPILAVVVTSLLEAKTDQVDNLVLPFIMYIILIV